MSREWSPEELRSFFHVEDLILPRIGNDARKCLGPVADTIKEVGLPEKIADWFRASRELVLFLPPPGLTFCEADTKHEIGTAIEIGRSDFGAYVISCKSGCVVYVDSSKETQLINTSISRFLFFVGRFRKSAQLKFADVDTLSADLREADPLPLANPEGIWSVVIEEARAGLY